MVSLLIIGCKSKPLADLSARLNQNGFICSTLTARNGLAEHIATQHLDLVLVETGNNPDNAGVQELVQKIKQRKNLPVIALVDREKIGNINSSLNVNDYLISPFDALELDLRIKRLIKKTDTDDSELVKHNGLIIDLAKCEVTVEGNVVELTFKEYELLKFLASNRGRVYTREALLNKVWGYDYYGGDRTVDVHVRRLRSKIEDSKHTFIETVRNIGYRFKDNTNQHLLTWI